MKLKSILIVALSVCANFAWAHSSEMFYQPLKSQTLLEGNIIHRQLEYDTSTLLGTTTTDFSDTALNLKIEHGFSDVYSGYFQIGYGSGEFDQTLFTREYNGLDMIRVGGQYQRHNDEMGRFLGTFDLAYGLGENDGENRTGNQLVLTIGIGYEKHMGENLFGGHVSYGLIATDLKIENAPDAEADGNLSLKLYYERSVGESSMGPMIFAGKLAYEQSGQTYWQSSYLDGGDITWLVPGLYTRIPMSERLHLLARLDYRLSIDEFTGLDSADGFDIGLGARMIF